MEQTCKEILKNLNIYEKNYTQYTRCLYREIEILISNKPEEKIRQIFLYFLIKRSGLYPAQIDLKVEYNNLDIAIYKNFESDNFRLLQSPIGIIEVKREEECLLNHENQLLKYLDEQRSSMGILFNARDIILLKKTNNDRFQKKYLKSMEDVPVILSETLNKSNVDYLEFKRASEGNIKSFVYLIKKYGKYTLHKFTFMLKTSSKLITGCCFSINQDFISYDLYAKYSRKQRFSFRSYDFDKLISVIY